MLDRASAEADRPVISVWQGRAVVGRYVSTGPATARFEPARNWRSLEAEAVHEIRKRCGSPDGGQFACPAALAAQATWTQREAKPTRLPAKSKHTAAQREKTSPPALAAPQSASARSAASPSRRLAIGYA